MPMYLISVYFDENTNRILRRYIDKIAEVTGNDFMITHKVPPHMTISAIEARNVDCLLPAFRSLENKLQSGVVDVVTVGQLLPYVMYGGAVLNEYLLDLSKMVYEAYKNIPDTSISKYYQPLSWLPHITLGKTLNKDQMAQSFGVMQESFAPFTAKITKIGLAKVNPHEDVAKFELNESKLTANGKYIGVDGCKGGWIASIYERGILRINKYSSVSELVDANKDYNELLIDMVIGLQHSKDEVRPDSAARALIPGRTSTIFAVPARQAVYAESREEIRKANINILGKDLPAQAIAIIPKMRELDEFLQNNPEHKNRLKESHPEVCFSRLKGSVIMSRKAEAEGITERVGIIQEYIPEATEQYVYQQAKQFKCNADDVVDSIVLAITANLAVQGKSVVIPDVIQEDATGLKMQMTIPDVK